MKNLKEKQERIDPGQLWLRMKRLGKTQRYFCKLFRDRETGKPFDDGNMSRIFNNKLDRQDILRRIKNRVEYLETRESAKAEKQSQKEA
jgi:hypothetical protein